MDGGGVEDPRCPKTECCWRALTTRLRHARPFVAKTGIGSQLNSCVGFFCCLFLPPEISS